MASLATVSYFDLADSVDGDVPLEGAVTKLGAYVHDCRGCFALLALEKLNCLEISKNPCAVIHKTMVTDESSLPILVPTTSF